MFFSVKSALIAYKFKKNEQNYSKVIFFSQVLISIFIFFKMVYEILSIVEYSCFPFHEVLIVFFSIAPNVCLYFSFMTFLFLWTIETLNQVGQEGVKRNFSFIKIFVLVTGSLLFFIWFVLFIIHCFYFQSEISGLKSITVVLVINWLIFTATLITLVSFIYFTRVIKKHFHISGKIYFPSCFNFRVFVSLNISISLSFQVTGLLMANDQAIKDISIACGRFDFLILIVHELF
jgi:hypothetical protein